MRRWGLAAAFSVAVASTLAAGAASAQPPASAQPAASAEGPRHASPEDTPTTTPIKHFLYLMQENHTFDNYFGTYPGADGIPEGTCMPLDPTDPSLGCVEPFRLGGEAVEDLSHTDRTFAAQYRDGANDGFIASFRAEGRDTVQAMGYYDGDDLPYYWNIADEYVLFDRFFTSARGGSIWNHMYWVTGTSGGGRDAIPEEGFGELPTIFDRLQEKGISWKFYVQNYDPGITFRTYRDVDSGAKGSQVVWCPLLDYARYLDDPKLFSRIVPLDEYFEDLLNGTLPSVAYLVPSGASEHPPGSIKAGERFVRTLLNELKRSSAWKSSAFLWTYDDWGGWYDHVPPPQVDEYGYGYRAPALLVSPYARRGHVDHTELDFTSGLKFIEENWRLEPLAARDANARNFLTAFDFTQPPREPVFLAATRDQPRPLPGKRHIIYLVYGSAISLPVGLVAAAALTSRRERVMKR